MTSAPLHLLWRIARRDLSAGFRGLRLLFLCLFLGVGALAAIGSLTAAITGELTRKGRELLGGDLEVALTQRYAEATEKAQMAQLGKVSETVRLRAMASGGGGPPMLSELKGVDSSYPLYGRLTVATPSGPVATDRPGSGEVLIERGLAERLGVGVGDSLALGKARFRISGVLASEPDRVGEGFSLGPAALIRLEDMASTGLIQPGSLFQAKYRIRLAPNDIRRPDKLAEDLKRAHGEAGWQVRDHGRAAPGASRFFERMGQFLGLIGLSVVARARATETAAAVPTMAASLRDMRAAGSRWVRQMAAGGVRPARARGGQVKMKAISSPWAAAMARGQRWRTKSGFTGRRSPSRARRAGARAAPATRPVAIAQLATTATCRR